MPPTIRTGCVIVTLPRNAPVSSSVLPAGTVASAVARSSKSPVPSLFTEYVPARSAGARTKTRTDANAGTRLRRMTDSFYVVNTAPAVRARGAINSPAVMTPEGRSARERDTTAWHPPRHAGGRAIQPSEDLSPGTPSCQGSVT